MTQFMQTVAAIKAEFPKHGPAALSLAHNTELTGVMLCPRAAEIERAVIGAGKAARKPAARNQYKLTVRLTKPVKRELNAAMKELGHSTVQAAIEEAVRLYIRKAAVGKTRPGGGDTKEG